MSTKYSKVVLSLSPTPPETIFTMLMPPTIQALVHRVSEAGGKDEAFKYNSTLNINSFLMSRKNITKCLGFYQIAIYSWFLRRTRLEICP